MKHASGQFLHEGRWYSDKELERLERTVELSEDPEAKRQLKRLQKRTGREAKEWRKEGPNLELESDTRLIAIRQKMLSADTKVGTEKFQRAVERLVGRYDGNVRDAMNLARCAEEILEARYARLAGRIATASKHEHRVEQIYKKLPPHLRW